MEPQPPPGAPQPPHATPQPPAAGPQPPSAAPQPAPAAPQPPPPPPQVAPAAYRLHSPAGVTWATILGTPASGGIVLALNYWKWGQKGIATATVVGGFLTAAIIGWLAWIVPASVPALVFLVPQVLLGYFVAKALQGRRFDAHVAAGGRKVSSGVGAAIGLGFSVLLIGAFALWFFSTGINPKAVIDAQESVDFGHGQLVFYSRGASRADAQDFGEALKRGGYFDDTTPTEVLITGRPRSHEISFAGGEGTWDDPANVDYIRQFVEYIAADIGGPPVTVLLLNEDLYEEQRCTLTDQWRCQPIS